MKDIYYQKLSHNNPLIRKNGAQAIWRRGLVKDLGMIQNSLIRERDPRVVKWLAFTLAKIGDTSSLEFLNLKLKAVENEDARDWIMVSQAILLESINGKPDIRRIQQLLSSQSADAQKRGALLSWYIRDLPKDVDEKLLKLLNHEDARVRRWSILSLGNSSELPPSSFVIGGLSDPDYLVREWTECVLASIKDPQAYSTLVDRLQDGHPRVREWAIKALASYNRQDTEEILIRHFLKETDELSREGTIFALQKWNESPTVRDFLLSVLSSEQSLVVLSAVVEALQTSKTLKTHPEVIETLLDFESKVMDDAIRLQIGSVLLSTCTDEEFSQISGILGSRKLRLLVDLLMEKNSNEEYLISSEKNHIALPLVSSRNLHSPSLMTLPISGDMDEPKIKHVDGIKKPIDIGIIVALKEEFRELFNSLQIGSNYSIVDDKEVGGLFYVFDLDTSDSTIYACVATLIGGMGPAKAAVNAERLLARYKPKTIAIIGIAASVQQDVRIGDIVIASQVDGYINSSKAVSSNTINNFEFELSGDVFHSSDALVKAITNYEFVRPVAFQQWLQESNNNLRLLVPESIREELVSTGIICEKPSIHEGHIASGPVVGATTHFTKWLLRRDRNYKALEMESFGLMEAATSKYNPPYILILRGVSDFGDHRKADLDVIKDGALRKLAMRNAVELLRSLVREGVFSRV